MRMLTGMNMRNLTCPHCNSTALTSWQKFNTGYLKSTNCANCKVKLCVPLWGVLVLVLPIAIPVFALLHFAKFGHLDEYFFVYAIFTTKVGAILGFILFDKLVPLVIKDKYGD
jgi:hypothetical protein